MLFFSGYNELYLQIKKFKKIIQTYECFIVGSYRRFSICNENWNFSLIKSFKSFFVVDYIIRIAYSFDLFIIQMWFLGDQLS